MVLSYGQGIVLSLAWRTFPKIYLALINQELYSEGTWFSFCCNLNWIVMIMSVVLMRFRGNHDTLTNLQSNHLLLKHCLDWGAAFGLMFMVMRVLTYYYISMNLYAHAVCYLLLIFIVLIMANHEDCLQFAIRKWRNCYLLSGMFVLYDMWIAIVNIMLGTLGPPDETRISYPLNSMTFDVSGTRIFMPMWWAMRSAT